MKSLIIVLLLSFATVARPQGHGILFNNRVTYAGVDAPVFYTGSLATAGIGLKAALYGIGGTVSNDASLVLLSNWSTGQAAVDFRTNAPGYVNVGTQGERYIPDVGYNALVTVQVRAWAGGYSSYEEAVAAGLDAGKSNLIYTQTWSNDTEPFYFPLIGLQSISFGIPEPTHGMLGVFGLLLMVLFHHKKRAR